MISVGEKRYLYWLTSSCYSGRGAVVEVGTWLGSSTIHLAAGLRDAGYTDRLHCYDRFEWRRLHGNKADLDLDIGDDFQPHFEANVRPIAPDVRVTKADLSEIRWDGGPIEILFLDAPKKLRAISDAFAAFGPALVPGLSVIVFQDYTHLPSYPLAAIVSCLSDRLELLHVVETGGTATFAVRGPLDFRDSQPREWNYATWTTERAVDTWNRVLEPLGAYARRRLESGIAFVLADLGDREAARQWLRDHAQDPYVVKEWAHRVGLSTAVNYADLFAVLGLKPTREARRARQQKLIQRKMFAVRRRVGNLLRRLRLLRRPDTGAE